MNKHCSRFLFQIFAINMWGLAVVGPTLFLLALLGWIGCLPEGASLKMVGRAVETNSEYRVFMALNASFGFLGWIYVWFRTSGRLQFVAQQER